MNEIHRATLLERIKRMSTPQPNALNALPCDSDST
jgi:hypothetical protein